MITKVVVDSANPVNYTRVYKSILKALEHFGIYYELIDLSKSRISSEELKDTHLLIFAQEGIGKSLSDDEATDIFKTVSQGMGLVVLDGYLELYPKGFLKCLNLNNITTRKKSFLKALPETPLSVNTISKEIVLKRDVLSCSVEVGPEWNAFLFDEKDNISGIYRHLGKGKVVIFLLSASLWQNECLGFTEGLDGVFINSIIWSAKKPYITKMMPPFITARIDDVSFSGSPVAKYKETVSNLFYLDILNRYGFTPNAGIFIDDIQKEDIKGLRIKHYDGLAEFSPHAFSDPKNINEHPIYMKHTGEEFSPEELKMNFEKVDKKFAEWGISPSLTVNAHFGEIGLRALPYLKARGERYFMNPIRIGKLWNDPSSHHWDVAPYGKGAFSLGYIPEDNSFFNVVSHPGKMDSSSPDFDFLCGCTTFWNESPEPDTKKAIARGVFHILRGLENGFFGCLMTHEQRISHLTPEHWEEIIKGITAEIKKVPHIFKGYDYISRYAENRTFYRIENAEHKDGISIHLKGRNTMPQYLYLFIDEGGKVVERFLEVPEFENSVLLQFSV
ncbi:MAG: hypothetical protein NC905_07250 [Candidatus Omnitrophica bacterium]|nr:hypothetical protein [Candidatus Omnitrophota bacterium]MCM8778032.1 hypothetical protein [Candidatus Omnitrophota bacterium]